jgi:hypothetical protein
VYWTAAHLFVVHQNAYSFVDAFNIQRALGWNGSVPLMFLCPPWVLPIIAPLGYAKSDLLAWLAWIVMVILATAMSSRLLMDLYFGSTEIAGNSHPRGYRYLFAFTFYPVLLALKFTQLAPLFLLGISGFIFFEKKESSGTVRRVSVFDATETQFVYPHLACFVIKASMETSILCDCPRPANESDGHLSCFPRVLAVNPFPTIVLSGTLAGVRSALGPQNTYSLQYGPDLGAVVVFFLLAHSWT